MLEEANILIAKLEVEGPQMPANFETYFKSLHKLHVAQAFSHMGVMKSATDCATLPEVLQPSKQLVYRWILECLQVKTMDVMPVEIKEWLDSKDENTMFSNSILEKRVIVWEFSDCLWWLEDPLGVVHTSEQWIHARFHQENLNSSLNVSTPSAPCIGATPKPTFGSRKGKEIEVQRTSFEPLLDDVEEEENLHGTFIFKAMCLKNSNFFKIFYFFVYSESSNIGANAHQSANGWIDHILFLFSTRVSIGFLFFELRVQFFVNLFGENFHTFVDALFLDVGAIDDMAWQSVESWFSRTPIFDEREYQMKGEPSNHVARLLFADFPTSMHVFGVHSIDSGCTCKDVHGVLVWNNFSVSLVRGVMEIAHMHLANEGLLVTLLLAQHLGKLVKYARMHSLHLHCSWTLMCDGGYLHPEMDEQVMDLTIGLFYRKSASGLVPSYDRKAREFVSSKMFPAIRSYLTELLLPCTYVEYNIVDGAMV
ncbi:hypothetical protein L7F22_031690 [Adiantum nelumboides]|nr:hypothetical protein [Adiantum nelumboides]